jgi:hypothetical protein
MNPAFSVAQPSCTTVETAAEVPLLLRLSAWVELGSTDGQSTQFPPELSGGFWTASLPLAPVHGL